MNQKANGFTIVELLIVVVVIAILAAITIVSYNGIQNSAHDSVVRSDIRTLSQKLEAWKVEKGRYPTGSELTDFKISKGSYDTVLNNVYYIVDLANDRYAFGARSKSGNGYVLTDTGVQESGSINGANTANAIGLSAFANTPGVSAASQGYSSGSWTNWVWVNS